LIEDDLTAKPAYSRRYLAWALGLLTLSYASSFMDRTIVSIAQAPMRAELGLSDTELGMLSGFAFAAFYSILGLPVARLAERFSRKTVISVSLLLWSLMTALSGTARSYGELFLWRMGVGVGEAGASPPAHSLITDYFPPHRRATAFSIYTLGIAGGVLAGSVAGGFIAERLGWRAAFFWFGAPGIFLAVLIQFTLREPARGGSDIITGHDEAPSLRDVVVHFLTRPALLHLAAGACLTALAGYGVNAFSALYLIRKFDIGLGSAGLILGISGGLAAGIGTMIGGAITDRMIRRDRRWYVWVPAIGLAVASPLYALAFIVPGETFAVALLIVAPTIHYAYIGPTYGAMHNMLRPKMRATGTALMYLVINLVGLGLGPPLIGFASDSIARGLLTASNRGIEFKAACLPGSALTHGSPAIEAACRSATADGIGWALAVTMLAMMWGAVHYAMAARTLRTTLISH
jgi:predicted MFS family arabinose efflux permease